MPQPTKQEEYSKSLRALADWYDKHPNVPVPNDLNVSTHFSVAELPLIPAEATVDIYESPSKLVGGLYRRVIEQDGFKITFYIGLSQVCDEKVVDTKTVEVKGWVLKPLIPAPESLVAASEANVEG